MVLNVSKKLRETHIYKAQKTLFGNMGYHMIQMID